MEQICIENLETALAKNPETYRHIDLIAFGFPCQNLSVAGNRKGLDGEQSGLFWQAMRIVRILAPRWVLIENVPGLLSSNKGRDMAVVLQSLAKRGYGWAYRVLDSRYFGVAQRRRRVFIVGSFGDAAPAAAVLFEPASDQRDISPRKKVEIVGLCLHAGGNDKKCCKRENYVASTITARIGERNCAKGSETHIAATIRANDNNCGMRGFEKANLITQVNSDGERKVSGLPPGLDSARGRVIGNAVTVHVAEWIGKRIQLIAK